MTFTAPLLAFVAINLLTVLTFAHDKARATSGGWRVRESTLLSLAFFGGSPGALWERRRFRHKTRKQPFSNTLHAIARLQVAALAGLVAWRMFG